MAFFIDRAKLIATLRTTGRPQSEVLSALRAQGALKGNKIPANLQELQPSDIRAFVTRDRVQRVLLDLNIAGPRRLQSTSALEILADKTIWSRRDRNAHDKFSPLMSRAIVGLLLDRVFPDQERESLFRDLSGGTAQTYRNLEDFSSGISGLGAFPNCEETSLSLRRMGIFQDSSRMDRGERRIFDKLAQPGPYTQDFFDDLLALQSVKKQDDMSTLIRVMRDKDTLIAEGKLVRNLELALCSVRAYSNSKESRHLALVGASAVASVVMGFMLLYRSYNLIEKSTLVIDTVAAVLLMWPELSSYWDTMWNKAFIAYGVSKLQGGHGQNHLPKQVSTLENIPEHEAGATHVVHAYQEAPSVCDMHMVYAARNADENTTVVFWDSSVKSYFVFGARGAIEMAQTRMALQGLFSGAIEELLPTLPESKRADLAKRMSDVNPELDDDEMAHIYYRDLLMNIGRDELAIGNRKLKLLAVYLSPIMLEASRPDANISVSEKWEASMPTSRIREIAVREFGVSSEKAEIFAKRAYARGLSASRKADITRIAQSIVEGNNIDNLQRLAILISEEYRVSVDDANRFLTAFLAERATAISIAYDTVFSTGKLLATKEGRALFADIYRYAQKIKSVQEGQANIITEPAEIFRQLIDKSLFVEADNEKNARLLNIFSRRELTMQMATEIAYGVSRDEVLRQSLKRAKDEISQASQQGISDKEKISITRKIAMENRLNPEDRTLLIDTVLRDQPLPSVHPYDLVNAELKDKSLTTSDFIDAERKIFAARSSEIVQVVVEVARRHGLPDEAIGAVVGSITEDWYMQNFWTETRNVAYSLANEVVNIASGQKDIKLLERDLPDKKKNPDFMETFKAFVARAKSTLKPGGVI